MTSRNDYADESTPGIQARRPTKTITQEARECVEMSPGVRVVKWIGDSGCELWTEVAGGFSVRVAAGTREAMHAAAKLQVRA